MKPSNGEADDDEIRVVILNRAGAGLDDAMHDSGEHIAFIRLTFSGDANAKHSHHNCDRTGRIEIGDLAAIGDVQSGYRSGGQLGNETT